MNEAIISKMDEIAERERPATGKEAMDKACNDPSLRSDSKFGRMISAYMSLLPMMGDIWGIGRPRVMTKEKEPRAQELCRAPKQEYVEACAKEYNAEHQDGQITPDDVKDALIAKALSSRSINIVGSIKLSQGREFPVVMIDGHPYSVYYAVGFIMIRRIYSTKKVIWDTVLEWKETPSQQAIQSKN